MEIKDPDKIQVGHWYSYCCEEDLTEISGVEELVDVRNQMRDDIEERRAEQDEWAGTGLRVWETEDEAMEALE